MQRTVYPILVWELTLAIKNKTEYKHWGMACREKWDIFYSSYKLEMHVKWWNIIEMSV